MDMFKEKVLVGCTESFVVKIFDLMKSQLLDEGPDRISTIMCTSITLFEAW